MPYAIEKIGGVYFVTKHGRKVNKKGYKSRTQAIKYQRALYANAPKSERAP